jgi:hypothetical protein
MPRRSPEDWSPNSLETQCLRHLDSTENWETVLKRPKPPESERLTYRPFVKIFFINILFFSLIITLLLTVVAIGTLGTAGLLEDLPLFIGFVATVTIIMAAYTTYLYRRSWNRRAQTITLSS